LIRVLGAEVPFLILNLTVKSLVSPVDVAEVVLGRVLNTHFENVLLIQLGALVLEILEVDKVELVLGLDVVWRARHFFILSPRLIINTVAKLECEVFLMVLLIPHKAVDSDVCPCYELQCIVVVCMSLRVRLILDMR
jgi:hypothetical protein